MQFVVGAPCPSMLTWKGYRSYAASVTSGPSLGGIWRIITSFLNTLVTAEQTLFGKKKVCTHVESPGLFRKTLPVSQALEHKTQVKLVANKFWMNYWWALEASFLLSPSELPAFEPWLWQHAQGLKNKDSNTYRNCNPHSTITIKRRYSVPACV